MNANLIIKRMRDAYGVDRDYELADKLGVKPGTVSGWKIRRGGVPPEHIEQTARDTGVDVETLTDGGLLSEGPTMPEKILTEMFLQIRGQMDKFDAKLDKLSEGYDSMKADIELLKKLMGECKNLPMASKQKYTGSQARTGT